MKLRKRVVAMLMAIIMLSSCISVFAAGGQRTLYKPDGTSKSFPLGKVASMIEEGWYKDPVQTLYKDGESKVFKKTQVKQKLKEGWSEEMVQVPEKGATGEAYRTLYAEDGRSKEFPESKVAAQLKVGWYEEPVQRLYAPGKSKVFPVSKVEAQLTVGWYISPIIKMYHPDGKTKNIADTEKADYEANGWYDYPVDTVYAPDGREKVIKASDLEAYKKVGWTPYPFFKVQCKEDNWEYGYKMFYWKYIPGVTNHTVTIIEQRNSWGANEIPANKPVVIKNVTSNYVYFNTYPNCSYTVKVTGGNSKGEATFYTYCPSDEKSSQIRSNIWNNAPKSKAEADPLMVKITVPIWKLSNGKKVSSTATISIHKDIAEVTKKVFNEIYNGKEKFPFKDIGGYNWRGGTTEHNMGTAIDINSNENYCIYGNGTVVGSHWKPGEDPYSIKPYGDVVRAFEKNGFTWGGDAWSSTVDYMHFSYCGT